jgi:hypothetical protein
VFVVRYVALVALAIWVGGMVAPFWLDEGAARIPRFSPALAYTCGATVLVSLFILKFVGPPPRAFPFRAALIVLMLAISAYAQALSVTSAVPIALNLVVGLILMCWYARE